MTLKSPSSAPCRCAWADLSKPDYVAYHDHEWGRAVHDDRVLFEFIVLESAQAGLSWYTILKKRDNYRRAFSQFDPEIIAQYDDAKVETLMQDAGIIRNRLKIRATISNAQNFLRIQKEFGSFDKYLWGFVHHQTIDQALKNLSDYPTHTPESDALAKDLKKRGFKFMGTTICYAYMQAVGLVNDHQKDCFVRTEKSKAGQ